MRIAFLVSAYTDAQHLERLIGRLPDCADFYIHIDRKADIEPFRQMRCRQRVTFIDERQDVQWGGISQVEFQMALFGAALRSGVTYDFFCTLSGLEYPVWNTSKIEEFFARHKGRNLLYGIDMSKQGRAAREYRVYRPLAAKTWKNGTVKNKMRVLLRILLKPFVHKKLVFKADGTEYHLFKGSDWFAVTPELAAYALEKWESCPQLRRYFRSSFIPSETFIHTVAFNSEFAQTCRLMEGEYKNLASLTPLSYIDYRPLIKILTEEDLEAILASGKMFCRKVVTGKSDRLMDLLDAQMAQPIK